MNTAVAQHPLDTRYVRLDQVVAHPANPRPRLERIDELADDIRERGILVPLLVCEHPDDQMSWLILAGHRRAAAAREAGLDEVPVTVTATPATDAEFLAIALAENSHRQGLDPISEAEALAVIRKETRKTAALAARVGRSTGWVSERLALLDLPDLGKGLVRDGELSLAVATQAARLGLDADAIDKVAKRPEAIDDIARAAERKALLDQLRTWIPDDQVIDGWYFPGQVRPVDLDNLRLTPELHAAACDAHFCLLPPNATEPHHHCGAWWNHTDPDDWTSDADMDGELLAQLADGRAVAVDQLVARDDIDWNTWSHSGLPCDRATGLGPLVCTNPTLHDVDGPLHTAKQLGELKSERFRTENDARAVVDQETEHQAELWAQWLDAITEARLPDLRAEIERLSPDLTEMVWTMAAYDTGEDGLDDPGKLADAILGHRTKTLLNHVRSGWGTDATDVALVLTDVPVPDGLDLKAFVQERLEMLWDQRDSIRPFESDLMTDVAARVGLSWPPEEPDDKTADEETDPGGEP